MVLAFLGSVLLLAIPDVGVREDGGREHGNCLCYFCNKIISKLKIQPKIRREGGRTREWRHVVAWGLYLRTMGIIIGTWRSLEAWR